MNNSTYTVINKDNISNILNQIAQHTQKDTHGLKSKHGKFVYRNGILCYVSQLAKNDKVLKINEISEKFALSLTGEFQNLSISDIKDNINNLKLIYGHKENKFKKLNFISRFILNLIFKFSKKLSTERNRLLNKEKEFSTPDYSNKENLNEKTNEKKSTEQTAKKEDNIDKKEEKINDKKAKEAEEQIKKEEIDDKNPKNENETQSSVKIPQDFQIHQSVNQSSAEQELQKNEIPLGSYRIWVEGDSIKFMRKILSSSDPYATSFEIINLTEKRLKQGIELSEKKYQKAALLIQTFISNGFSLDSQAINVLRTLSPLISADKVSKLKMQTKEKQIKTLKSLQAISEQFSNKKISQQQALILIEVALPF